MRRRYHGQGQKGQVTCKTNGKNAWYKQNIGVGVKKPGDF